MPTPRLMLLYNEPVLPPAHPDSASEREILDTMNDVGKILDAAGFDVRRYGVGADLRPFLDVLANDPPAAVFNLFEGLADRPFTESVIAGMMDWFGVPYTGCPADALSLARDKHRAKTLLRGADLPTAAFFAVERGPCPPCPLRWPVIVKPAGQDASVGIEQGSVVTDQAALARRVELVLEQYGPVIVEEFIAGREFLVSVIEVGDAGPDLLVLPPAEIEFKDKDRWPIYSYQAKWSEDSPEYSTAPLVAPAEVPAAWAERFADIARRAYRLLGCRDYARVDLRVTPDGRPHILEVNPNPFINSWVLTDCLEAVGRSHVRFIADLARAALSRRGSSTAHQTGRLPLETP